jgi:hypothetical protein
MSEQGPEHTEPSGQDQVERGGADEASGAPLSETEIETSKRPEDRDSNV